MSTPREKEHPTTAAGCLAELMRRVDAIAKAEEHRSPGANFNFRGVDTVTNVIGPELRDLGLIVLPEVVEHGNAMLEYGAKRTLGRFVTVLVRYRFVGPDGSDLMVGPVYGEAMDSGDKAGAKAMSVAYRTMWLQTLAVPTGDRDPDHDAYEVAKPEASFTDPVVEKRLREKIEKADGLPALRECYKAVEAEFAGDKATITQETRNLLMQTIKDKVERVQGQAPAGPAGGGQG